MREIGTGDLIGAFGAVAEALGANRDRLCALDGEIGDADHGIGMALGFGKVHEALAGLGGDATPSEAFNTAAKAFLSAVGASSGPLYATALMRAGAAFKGQQTLGDGDAARLLAAMAEGIAHRGKAAPGDKTMLDVWQPAAEAAARAQGGFGDAMDAAAERAEAAAEETREMEAKLGRAARLGARSVGHVDPGAASAALIIRTLSTALGG